MRNIILTSVTFTGADDATDVGQLAAIARAHPWVEFAALVSPTRAGTDRYPSRAWRSRFYRSDVPAAQRALHLCGTAMQDLINGTPDLRREIEQVARVQLNFTVARFGLEHTRSLCRLLASRPFSAATAVIAQHNLANVELPTLLALHAPSTPVTFLVDGSGGRGVSPRSWRRPITGHDTGYAGGIGHDNVVATISALSELTDQTFIDMESSLRTAGEFDLTKVRAVIQALTAYCEPVTLPNGRAAIRFAIPE